MRNAENGVRHKICALTAALGMVAMSVLLVGCASGPTPKEKLATAYKELESPTPNYAEMIEASDAYLKENPTGPAAADALYLHGRALEGRAAQDAASAPAASVEAYNYYSQALTQKPRPALEGLIHVGMGNVLYFQDRYSAAVGELTAGYDKLERDSDKAWALYRIGLCNQRMGHWAEADRDFSAVQQQFPNTEPAQRAREHQGATAFWVQVGTFATPAAADAAAADLKRQGITGQLFHDTVRNLQYVRVGPLNSYESAVVVKQRVLGKYRDAMIMP
jgi:tetratricopeptide (TPR) repeat protein